MNRPQSTSPSLAEVHGSIDTTAPGKVWRKVLAFFGPAYLVSVGYMDPGNWATDIAGGSAYGYTLVWVLLMSNIMALLLQSLSARLGIVRGRDLAQASRDSYPQVVNFVLYVLAEIAIAACDLAEVLGMAIGLQLLFGLPLIWGVSITILDTILLLFLQRLGMRKMEIFIISLVTVIGLSFFAEILFAKPSATGILHGFIPRIPDSKALYITIGIIGATVMPHNLYLHSALVQSRKIERTRKGLKEAIRYSVIDSAIALNIALLVNASILILAAAAFFSNRYYQVADITDAHKLLEPLLGTALAPLLFAIALIASGQSSTITGTLAGQVVMEGYLNLRLPMWLRRLITRLLAVIPAFLVIYFMGEDQAPAMLVLSQVILSIQLGFAVVPLIHMVSDKQHMGDFAIKTWTQIASWLIAAIIIVFNVKLIWDTLLGWLGSFSPDFWWLRLLVVVACTGFALLLAYIVLEPVIRRRSLRPALLPHKGTAHLEKLEKQVYSRIGVTIDFSERDRRTLEQALQQGGREAEYLLIHVVETPGALLNEKEVGDFETGADRENLLRYEEILRAQGYRVSSRIGYGRRVKTIAKIVNESGVGLLVMGAHGHRAFKDVLFGETIDSVRHRISADLLAVR